MCPPWFVGSINTDGLNEGVSRLTRFSVCLIFDAMDSAVVFAGKDAVYALALLFAVNLLDFIPSRKEGIKERFVHFALAELLVKIVRSVSSPTRLFLV